MSTFFRLINGSKTDIGNALIALGIAMGVFSPEDVEGIQAAIPVLTAAAGAVMQVIGIVHRIVKRARG